MPCTTACRATQSSMSRVNRVLPIDHIGAELARLAALPATSEAEPVTEDLERESGFAEIAMDAMTNANHPGTPSGFACPDCGGALWRLRRMSCLRYRCRVGHAWSGAGLLGRADRARWRQRCWMALRAWRRRPRGREIG